jgi:hypothetical protein
MASAPDDEDYKSELMVVYSAVTCFRSIRKKSRQGFLLFGFTEQIGKGTY